MASKNYKHGDTLKVNFTGYLSRTQAVDQATGQVINRKYYRMNFMTKDGVKSVSSSENISNKAAIVMFVEKGQPGPGGRIIAEDAWSLQSIVDVASIKESKQALDALNELGDL